MLGSEAKQFKIDDQGVVFWQSNSTNPLPGVVVAQISKGEALLRPAIALMDDAQLPEGVSAEDALKACQDWLTGYVQSVLEPLFKLLAEAGEDEVVTDNVKAVAQAVHDAMGIVAREDLDATLSKLDVDERRVVRRRGVRLGPLLVFMPLLNKPAAVRLRALLWWMWNDRALPAPVPNDGIVSVAVDQESVDKDFHQKIGYPVYGPKAIRIDMVDRVLNAIYDQADKGIFKAEHKMAEWLGCSIADLYAVLEAMGHKKIHDPADEAEKVEAKAAADAPVEAAPVVDVVAEAVVAEVEVKAEEVAPVPDAVVAEVPVAPEADAVEAPVEDAKAEDVKTESEAKPAAPVEQVKPELATFRLKRGKAHSKGGNGKPKFDHKKKPSKEAGDKPKSFKKHTKKKDNKFEQKPRVMSAEPKKKKNVIDEDSPFAILAQLKGK